MNTLKDRLSEKVEIINSDNTQSKTNIVHISSQTDSQMLSVVPELYYYVVSSVIKKYLIFIGVSSSRLIFQNLQVYNVYPYIINLTKWQL